MYWPHICGSCRCEASDLNVHNIGALTAGGLGGAGSPPTVILLLYTVSLEATTNYIGQGCVVINQCSAILKDD